jgi:hypothetical protein
LTLTSCSGCRRMIGVWRWRVRAVSWRRLSEHVCLPPLVCVSDVL